MKHTMVALVENKPGVLARVALLFRRRNFNIESLTVCQTESPELSRMTIVVNTEDTDAALVEKNLRKLINVLDVHDLARQPTVARDLALIKVQANASTRAEIAQLADIFRAKIIDVASDSVIVEATGDEEKIDGLIQLLKPKGVLELARTGRVAMMRGSDAATVRPNGNGHNAGQAATETK
jgi:acetolactate synthase I/III small subunit